VGVVRPVGVDDGELVDTGRRLLATGPLCDACCGRPLADRSHGLTNAERGRALRVAVALADDRPVGEPPVAAVDDCWVCEGVCDRFDVWTDAVVAALDRIGFETYQIGTRVPPLIEENERLLREEAGLGPEAGEPINRECNREVGKRVGARIEAAVDRDRPDAVATLDLGSEQDGDVAAGGAPESGVDVRINPAFVYGRYRKLERGIPQTRWPCRECDGAGEVLRDGTTVTCDHCDGAGKLYPTSVEELVAPPIVEAMDGREAVFHGAGREDVDARMLGTGRPFVVEVKRPLDRSLAVDAVAAAIDDRAADRVAVDGLRRAAHTMVERVKELSANKTYCAEVRFGSPVSVEALEDALDTLSGATIEQYTPERVDHRRASRTRTRTVHTAEGRLDAPTDATVEFETEGGLYVKELVSGDDGRTEPSLAGLLGVEATVTVLDVLAVKGATEPFEMPAHVR
jgi:tRNA pseudouridine synthase 10